MAILGFSGVQEMAKAKDIDFFNRVITAMARSENFSAVMRWLKIARECGEVPDAMTYRGPFEEVVPSGYVLFSA